MTRETYIDSKMTDIEILAKKAKVIIEDLDQGYFGERVETAKDVWKITGLYYDHAGTKVSIVNDLIFELMRNLSNLSNVLAADDDVERELKLYELMDKHGCNYNVAELLLQDQKERKA